MGNIMKPFGNWGDFPESFMPPTFDQNLGFPNGRKERGKYSSGPNPRFEIGY